METTQHFAKIADTLEKYRSLARDMDALLDRLRADNAKAQQDLAEVQRDRDEWKAEAARLEHLWNDTCEERDAATNRASRANYTLDIMAAAIKGMLGQRRRHRSTASAVQYLETLVTEQETTPVTQTPMWIRITQIPEDHPDQWLKIKVVKKVREVANLLLQEAKRVVDSYGWFTVAPDQQDVWRTWARDNRVRYHVADKPE